MKKSNELEKELAIKMKEAESRQNEIESLRKKIEANQKAEQPKSIIDRVNTIEDVLKIAKPTKEELPIINYSGKSKRIFFAKHMMVLSLISEVLNEGHVFTMKPDEERWYCWFDVSSGFVFVNAHYDVSSAGAGSASRLCLKNRELTVHAGEVFTKYYKNAIMMK